MTDAHTHRYLDISYLQNRRMSPRRSISSRKHFLLSQHHKAAHVHQVIPGTFKTSVTAKSQLCFEYEAPLEPPHELTQNVSTQKSSSAQWEQCSARQWRCRSHQLPGELQPVSYVCTKAQLPSRLRIVQILNFHSHAHHFYAKASQAELNQSSERDRGLAVGGPRPSCPVASIKKRFWMPQKAAETHLCSTVRDFPLTWH